jgi:hypothetical protein
LIEAVEPGLNDGLNGLDANPLLLDKFAQAVAVNEIDRWRICRRRFSCGGGEAAQRDKDSPFGAGRRSVSLKQGDNVTTQCGSRIVALRLHRNTRRQHFADGSETNSVNALVARSTDPSQFHAKGFQKIYDELLEAFRRKTMKPA